MFIAEVTKIVKSRADILLGKGNGALRVIQLLLHPDVKINEPFCHYRAHLRKRLASASLRRRDTAHRRRESLGAAAAAGTTGAG